MKYRPFCWSTPAYAGYYHAYKKHCTNRHASKHPNHNAMETRWHRGGGASFGVRRPLRYLSHRLDLDESQMRRMASVLNQLKTEREQTALDEKRTVANLAGLLTEGTPTLEDCKAQLAGRVNAAEHMQNETAKAVIAISELLDEDQRGEFIDLLLTGEFTL